VGGEPIDQVVADADGAGGLVHSRSLRRDRSRLN
jgi:hypothetical protein